MKVLHEIAAPQDSVNDLEITILSLKFVNGDHVTKGDAVIEIESSKATFTIEADESGFIYYLVEAGADVRVGSVLARIIDSRTEISLPDGNRVEKEFDVTEKLEPALSPAKFSRKAAQLAEKHNVSTELFNGCDFVTEKVVREKLHLEVPARRAGKKEAPLNLPAPAEVGAAKKREIRFLSAGQNSGLASTLFVTVNAAQALHSVRKSLSIITDSILVIVLFETSRMLLKYPLLNSFFNGDQVFTHSNINVGVALDMEKGLTVVSLRDTDKMGIPEIESSVFELANKYLDQKLEVTDMSDVTFTVTDLSSTEVTFFSPLINRQNAAILGLSKIDQRTGQCVLSMAFDHRVTEGRYVAMFLSELKSRIESYSAPTGSASTDITCHKCLKSIDDDLNALGFIKVVARNGEEKLVCDTCFFRF